MTTTPTLSHFSASQIKLFNRCPRRWYYKYVEKLPTPPPSDALKYGTLIHEQVEAQIQGDDTPTREKAPEPLQLYPHAIPYLQHLWRLYHAGWLLVEKDIHIDTPSGIPIIGRADVVMIGRIVDHKTTSDKKYMLKPDALAQDLQAQIYMYWYHQQNLVELFSLDQNYQQTETSVFVHNYFNKKKHYSTRIEAPIDRASNALYAEEKIFPVTEKMKTACTLEHNNVQLNKSDCWSYGQPCPFFKRCQKGQTKEEALMTSTLERLERIRAKKREATRQPTLEEAVEAYHETGDAPVDKLSHEDKVLFVEYRKDYELSMDKEKVPEPVATQSIVPPDQTPDHAPGEIVDRQGKVVSEFEHYKVSSKLIEALNAAGVDSFEAANALPEKYWQNLITTKGNGIGKGKVETFRALAADKASKKSETEPFKDDQFVQDTKALYEEPNTPETVVEIKEPAKPKKEEKAPKGFSLLINCDFMRVNGYEERIVRLEDVVQRLSRIVQDQQEVPHWSLSPYATGAGHLAALLKEQIADGEFEKKIIVCNSFFPASSALLEVLMPEAHTIVGALR